jgi:hypothetical protein
VIRQLHNSDFSVRIDARDFELSLAKFIPEPWIEAVVAGKLLPDFWLTIGLMGM